MRTVILAIAALLAVALPASAQDFSAASEAKGWGPVQGKEKAKFKAKVVDVLCELSGDCTEKCGGGKRQMGLLREADGALILAAKNNQPVFSGATEDLAPYCGKTVTVDGFMVGNPDVSPTKFYLVQTIMREGTDKKAKAARWTRVWNRKNPELAEKKGAWFRKHPAILEQVAKTGWLGLGAEADKAFIEENY